jgi:signal transduction histidine kinase
MADASDPSSDPDAPTQRSSFRRRLLVTVGPAVALALGTLALIAWGTAYVVVHQNAHEALEGEVSEMRADVRIGGDTLDVGGYAWNEAHHLLAVDRVDPIFVQVFDAERRLVRQSPNADSLSATYPENLISRPTADALIPTLRTFRVSGRTLYYRVRPLRGPEGRTVGYVQVARFVPTNHAMLRPFGLGMVGLWAVLSASLLGLVAWAAGRVLRPLRRITQVAESVRSTDLSARVHVPAHADYETATLARTFNALLDRLEEHVEALRTFTANAAHELQTPLTVLRGHVEIALRRDRDAESYRETLHLLDRKLGELVRTLRALLTLTRLDREDGLEREPVDLAALAADEVESLRATAEEKGLTLSMSRTESAWVNGQPDLLREAIRNVVDNALKYTPEGQVRVAVQPTADMVRLRCADTGVGIDEEDLDQVTSRFYRGDPATQSDAEGSGLGLALVRRIVEEHEGSVTIRVPEDGGTTVVIELPAAEHADDRP